MIACVYKYWSMALVALLIPFTDFNITICPPQDKKEKEKKMTNFLKGI